MPETYATPAIVLNRRAYRGYDQRVSLYTLEKGKVELLVKGALRPASRLAAHLEPLNRLDVMVVVGKIAFVGGAASRDCYPNLKGDYDKLEAAGAAVGRLNRLLKEQVVDEPIFYLLKDFLSLLDKHSAEVLWYQWLANMFLYKLLEHLGYGINFVTHQTEKGPKLDKEMRALLSHAQALSISEIGKLKVSRNLLERTNPFLDFWIQNTCEF